MSDVTVSIAATLDASRYEAALKSIAETTEKQVGVIQAAFSALESIGSFAFNFSEINDLINKLTGFNLAASFRKGFEEIKALGSDSFGKVKLAAGGMAVGIAGATVGAAALAANLLSLGIAAAQSEGGIQGMADNAIASITSLTSLLPEVASQVVAVLPEFVAQLTSALPELAQALGDAFSQIVTVLPEVLPALIAGLADFIGSLAVSLVELAPTLMGPCRFPTNTAQTKWLTLHDEEYDCDDRKNDHSRSRHDCNLAERLLFMLRLIGRNFIFRSARLQPVNGRASFVDFRSIVFGSFERSARGAYRSFCALDGRLQLRVVANGAKGCLGFVDFGCIAFDQLEIPSERFKLLLPCSHHACSPSGGVCN